MPDTPARASTRRPIDGVALRRVLRRLAGAAEPPWLHGEVARRMADRLKVIRLQPASTIDWWSASGASRGLLQAAYPKTRLLAVERDEIARAAAETQAARPWWAPQRWAGRALEPLGESSVASGQGQLLWANMMLHAAIDPQRLMVQWHQALAVEGFLMFSTLGPGTLERLTAIYRAEGWGPPFAPFVDMHDLGDMLVQAGFADPVMDQEQLTLTWPDADALLAELRTLGGNIHPARHPGLRTLQWRRCLAAALGATAGPDGRLRLQFEVVYGHAFRPAPRPRLAEQTSVPLDDMRAMVRAGRRPAG
jgi:malonyl-CoA O-methyltransferase